jgi:hypothetical protein
VPLLKTLKTPVSLTRNGKSSEASGVEFGQVCSWDFFWGYWNRNHSKTIVRKPSKDICGLCYQFHLGDRTTTSSSTPNNLDNDESSLQSDDNNKEDNGEDGTLMEACEQENSKNCKSDQTVHQRCNINESTVPKGD